MEYIPYLCPCIIDTIIYTQLTYPNPSVLIYNRKGRIVTLYILSGIKDKDLLMGMIPRIHTLNSPAQEAVIAATVASAPACRGGSI